MAALEPFCRIVLRDISIQPATVDVVAESRSSSARKEPEQGGPAASVSGAVEEEEEEGEGGKTEEEEEGQRPFHDETASLRPSSPIGVVAGPLGVDGATVERRLLLDPTNLGSGYPRRRRPVVKDPVDAGSSTTSSSSSSSSSSSISPKSTSPSSSSSTSSTTFSVAATGPTTLSLDAPSNSIPVLEKHGSGDEEVVPATKDKDEGGEEREMPQLTLYA